jgi:hypothetical protein
MQFTKAIVLAFAAAASAAPASLEVRTTGDNACPAGTTQNCCNSFQSASAGLLNLLPILLGIECTPIINLVNQQCTAKSACCKATTGDQVGLVNVGAVNVCNPIL